MATKKSVGKKKLTIDDLKPAPYNPRTITQDAINGLQSSLDKFGDIAGITWNKRSGNLVAGHQRLESLKRLYGDKLKFDGVKISCPDGKEFTVRVVDWDEPMEKAANITANNQLLQGNFEMESLSAMVDDLSGFDGLEDLRMDNIGLLLSSTAFKKIEVENGVTDAMKEWEGMPEFEQSDNKPFRSIIIHFQDQGGVDGFLKTIGRKCTEKTKFLWFPDKPKNDLASQGYVDEEK